MIEIIISYIFPSIFAFLVVVAITILIHGLWTQVFFPRNYLMLQHLKIVKSCPKCESRQLYILVDGNDAREIHSYSIDKSDVPMAYCRICNKNAYIKGIKEREDKVVTDIVPDLFDDVKNSVLRKQINVMGKPYARWAWVFRDGETHDFEEGTAHFSIWGNIEKVVKTYKPRRGVFGEGIEMVKYIDETLIDDGDTSRCLDEWVYEVDGRTVTKEDFWIAMPNALAYKWKDFNGVP